MSKITTCPPEQLKNISESFNPLCQSAGHSVNFTGGANGANATNGTNSTTGANGTSDNGIYAITPLSTIFWFVAGTFIL